MLDKNLNEKIKNIVRQSIICKEVLLSDAAFLKEINNIVDVMSKSLTRGNKILFCGNGGSAADAQHIAAELSGRFYKDRKSLRAEALHTNTSYITAVSNDYSFDEVYSRLIEGSGDKGDILVSLSTSGSSANIINAIKMASNRDMINIGLTGEGGGRMNNNCDFLIRVPSKDTPRIQEAHIMIGHIICELVEEILFDNE